MPQGNDNPFAADAAPTDPHNPYAAPQTMDEVAQDADSELATRGARFVGSIIDGLTMIPAIAMIFYLSFNLGVSGALGDNQIFAGFVGGLIGAAVGTIWYLLLNGYLLANRGQTIGKIVVRTRIVDAQTNELVPLMPLVLKRVLSIQALSLIPIIGGFISLIDAVLIFRENRRCLHDDFAGTKVIKVS